MQRIVLKQLNHTECARYLGYGTSIPDEKIEKLMRECETQICEIAVPRFVSQIFAMEQNEKGILLQGSEVTLSGNSIREHLTGCDRAILLCVTLSGEIDRLIRKMEVLDMAKAVVMNAMAAVAVEQAAEQAADILYETYRKEKEIFFTWRFGFGYGDLPLKNEAEALKLLDAQKRIGVSINESLMMFPKKTIACVIGVSDKPVSFEKKGCNSCTIKEKCQYRQKGEHCGF